MTSATTIMHLCRLCLVKDQVNVPIFANEDIPQTCDKISTCLPVKVEKDDKLPKNICNGCSYKLDLLYQFYNTTVSAEKQLLLWLEDTIKDTNNIGTVLIDDSSNDKSSDVNDYVLQQQKLPYQNVFPYQEQQPAVSIDSTSENKRKRKILLPDYEASSSKMTRMSDLEDNPTHDDDTNSEVDQPGPSGMGKEIESPFATEHIQLDLTSHTCYLCSEMFVSNDELDQHITQFEQASTCCKCELLFEDPSDYTVHIENHKNNVIIKTEIADEETVEEEAVELNLKENEDVTTTDELLYILDDNQCVNEVVIEEEEYKGSGKEQYTTVMYEEEYVEETPKAVSIPKNSNTVLSISKTVVKQKHEVPHFSATNYVLLSPNEEVNIQHYKCLRCEQLFINKFVFYRHIEKGKCYINSCDICPARFTKNTEFYMHYVKSHPDRAICNFCFRTFMYEKNVKEHMLRHLDQFRHRCEECNKGFYTIREYRNHYKNRHMGIRHKCETCNRTFADEYYFKRHIASHNVATETE